MIEELKKNLNRIVGTKQTLRALKEDRVKAVFIANDAEIHVTRNVKEEAQSKNIELIYIDSMKELGLFCNIEVGAAIACLLK